MNETISAYNPAVNPFWIYWRDWNGFPLEAQKLPKPLSRSRL